MLVTLTILFLAGLFKDLPETVLAAIIIKAVWGLLNPSKLVRLYRDHLGEFWLALGAALGLAVAAIPFIGPFLGPLVAAVVAAIGIAGVTGLLGPLLVRRDGAIIPVQRGKQRALLAALLLSPGRVRPAD